MKDNRKIMAQQLYISTEMTMEAIAKQVGCTPKTLRAWRDNGEWDQLKELRTATRPQLLKDAYAMMAAVNAQIKENGGVPTKLQYDTKSVLRKEIEVLSNVQFTARIETFTEFLDWLRRNAPQHIKTFSDLSMKYLNTLGGNNQ